MGSAGSVAWLFDSRGVITVDTEGKDIDELTLQAIDTGAEDVKVQDISLEIYTKPNELEIVKKGLEKIGLTLTSAELSMIPKTLVEAEDKAAISTMKLLERMEELDDVQKVFTNVDFSDDQIEKFRSGEFD